MSEGECGLKMKGSEVTDSMDVEEVLLRKRLPRKLPKRKNDIYISRKTNPKVQLERCKKLLESGANEMYIHGLGAAVNRAMVLALKLQAQSAGSLQLAPCTSTVETVDDLEPENEDMEPETQTRNSSAIHIHVYRPEQPAPHPQNDGGKRTERKGKK